MEPAEFQAGDGCAARCAQLARHIDAIKSGRRETKAASCASGNRKARIALLMPKRLLTLITFAPFEKPAPGRSRSDAGFRNPSPRRSARRVHPAPDSFVESSAYICAFHGAGLIPAIVSPSMRKSE